MKSIIDKPELAEEGRQRLRWFREQMPLVASLSARYREEKPFSGLRIAVCMHVEPKTAVWLETFLEGGAEHIYLVGNLGTTRADTAAWLAADPRITVLARQQDTLEEHHSYLDMVMEEKPDLLLDNGASLILRYLKEKRDWLPLGANEETRTGRLLIDDSGYEVPFPVIVIDDSPVKRLLENAIGVGQSVIDGFMRSTSLLIGGLRVLTIGYGYVGSGIAKKFRAMGAITSVYDSDPVYLLKARIEGHEVDTCLESLISRADLIITATGRFHIIRKEHIAYIHSGTILANAGHYSFEIDTAELKEEADSVEDLGRGKEQLLFKDKKIFLLSGANPLNLASGDGNPIEIIDLGLSQQAASAARLATDRRGLVNGVQPVPKEIDELVSLELLKAGRKNS